MYICAISYLEISKFNIRNSFYRLLSRVFFYWCLAYKRPTVISQHVWVSFTAVSFFPFGIYPDGTIHRACRRRLSYFPGENQSGVARCTPRFVVRKADPQRVQRSFLNFHFPKSCCMRFQTHLRLFRRQHSIYFWSRGLEKAVLLQDSRQCQRRGCSISIAEYFAVFDFFFLQNYSFTPFCRRFHYWYRDPSSWASAVGRSNPELGRSSQPHWSSCWKILAFPRIWPSFWWSLFRFCFWVQSIIFWWPRYWHWVITRDGSQCRGILGYSCFVFRFSTEAIGVSYAKTSVAQVTVWGSRHTIGTAQALTCAYLLTNLSNDLEHELQQIFVTRTLSWTPALQPKWST